MSLYPEIEPYQTHRLEVSNLHEIYFEEVGNPEGIPIVFVHGGPGSGAKPRDRRFFDPKKYRVILFDQRGTGRSKPFAELKENTTWDLVADMEKIREKLGISDWVVFGGSWGSTLSLSYAVSHPNRVRGLILRGIFLCRTKEFDWLYQNGANRLFPETYQEFLKPIPENERKDLLTTYHRYLTGDDTEKQLETARAWSIWEGATSKLIPDPGFIDGYGDRQFCLPFARIETHYFVNNAFFESEQWLIEQAGAKLQDIRIEIVHGRYDIVCPMENAWELCQVLPKANLYIIDDAGHSAQEVGIAAKLVELTDRF